MTNPPPSRGLHRWAVFTVLGRHVSSGEIADVQHVIPEDLRSLWPGGEVTRGS